jgi:DNA-binding transcriptional ArsR family regulator
MNDYVLDLPPEFCQYQDEGCEFAPSCLNCPLPICVYEEPAGKERLMKKRRAAKMEQLFVKEGKTIRELSQIFKVSRRTVQRALKVSFGENGVYSANPRSEK